MEFEKADQLIVQVLQGSASEAERAALDRWREAAPENERRYQDVVAIWKSLGPDPGSVASGPPSADEVIAAADRRQRGDSPDVAADRQPLADEDTA